MEICRLLGIGILILNKNGDIKEILSPERNEIDVLSKKEMIYRIFLKDTEMPISSIILQACYEYKLKTEENCVQYLELYNSLFSNEKYKILLNKVLKKHGLTKMGMRREFQKVYGETDLIEVQKMNRRLDDYICITNKGEELGKEPVLLDCLLLNQENFVLFMHKPISSVCFHQDYFFSPIYLKFIYQKFNIKFKQLKSYYKNFIMH